MASRKSRRSAITAGIGLGGLMALGESAFAQDPPVGKPDPAPTEPKGDEEKPGPSKAAYAAAIGVIDMEAILNNSRSLLAAKEELRAEATIRQKELQKLIDKGNEHAQDLKGLTPGTPEHDRLKGRLEELGGQLEAEKRKAKQEFAAKEARALAAIYKEVEKHVEAVARSRGLGLILRVSNGPIDPDKPETVMNALGKAVVFSDPRLDITAEVRNRMNRR